MSAASEISKMLPSEAAFQDGKESNHVRVGILLYFLSPEVSSSDRILKAA